MVSKYTQKKSAAQKKASKYRKMGYSCTVYKKKKGYGVSVTRKK